MLFFALLRNFIIQSDYIDSLHNAI